MLQVAADPAAMIDKLKRYIPPLHDKWAEKRNAV
jgi:hypothetical protein